MPRRTRKRHLRKGSQNRAPERCVIRIVWEELDKNLWGPIAITTVARKIASEYPSTPSKPSAWEDMVTEYVTQRAIIDNPPSREETKETMSLIKAGIEQECIPRKGKRELELEIPAFIEEVCDSRGIKPPEEIDFHTEKKYPTLSLKYPEKTIAFTHPQHTDFLTVTKAIAQWEAYKKTGRAPEIEDYRDELREIRGVFIDLWVKRVG